MILNLEGILSFHNPLMSYKKLKSPVIKIVGASEIRAAPIAVEVLPSIPLVPRLQKKVVRLGQSINCA